MSHKDGGQISDKYPPEIRDQRIENKYNNIVEKKSRLNMIKEIVDYLNQKINNIGVTSVQSCTVVYSSFSKIQAIYKCGTFHACRICGIS